MTCANGTHCAECSDSSYFHEGSCVEECPIGFLTNSERDCQPCSEYISGCEECSYNATQTALCDVCLPTYLMSPDSLHCVQDCHELNTSTALFSAKNGSCLQCIDGCILCQEGVCQEC